MTNYFMLVVATLSCSICLAPRAGAQKGPVPTRVTPAADSAVAREVLGRTRQWHDAIMRADSAAIRAILLPEFSLTVPPDIEEGHVPLERYISNLSHYQLHEDRWEASDVRILGNVAVVTSRFWQRATPRGRDRSGYFVLTDLWRRDGTEWRVVARWSTWLDAPGGISPTRRQQPRH